MTQLTEVDIDFMKWLDQPENIHYWSSTDTGEKVLIRDGWNKAHEEYMKIKQIQYSAIGMPPVKYARKDIK